MASFKIGRLSEDIKRELSLEVSGDLSHCKVNVSALEGETATKESIKGLNSASGFLRRELGNRLHLRKCPELHFIPDGSIAYSAKINHILQELDLEEEAGDEPKE